MIYEGNTDDFIGELLKEVKITPNFKGTDDAIIEKTLKDASKNDSGNSGFPDIVAFSNGFPLIFENKKDMDNQVLYLNESETKLDESIPAKVQYAENGALHYAKHIVAHKDNPSYDKVFAFGCSGSKDNYIIRPIFVDNEGYKLLSPINNFENFKKENIDKYYHEQVLEETPLEILELEEVIDKAKELNGYLRTEGSLGNTEKSLVVSAILLALNKEGNIRDNLNGGKDPTDGQTLYNEIEFYLKSLNVPENKREVLLNQFSFIKTNVMLNNKKEIKQEEYKIDKDSYLHITPLKFFVDFIYKNIYGAVKYNKQEDILAKFYSQFVSYEGDDKKELGIVLTPTHITDLFCDLVGLNSTDTVLDPCCGTGSFLLSAMNKMISDIKSKDLSAQEFNEELKSIKEKKLFGIEIKEFMFSIATANMILRGDGKSNLRQDDFFELSHEKLDINCFSFTDEEFEKTKELRSKSDYEPKYCSVGFMNPPYAQGKSNKYRSEIHYILQLLNAIKVGGRAAAIVPIATMVGKNSTDRAAKKKILEKHTLEGVITLNPRLFEDADVNTGTCIAIFECNKPHPPEKYVKFIDFKDDGYVYKSKIGLVETERAKERKSYLLDCWLYGKKADSNFMIEHKINHDDEWIHAYYAFNDQIPDIKDFEKTINDYLTFEFSMILNGKDYLFENKDLSDYYGEN